MSAYPSPPLGVKAADRATWLANKQLTANGPHDPAYLLPHRAVKRKAPMGVFEVHIDTELEEPATKALQLNDYAPNDGVCQWIACGELLLTESVVAASVEELNMMKNHCTKAQADRGTHEANIKAAREKISDLETQVDQAQRERQKAEAQIKTLRQELEKSQSETTQAQLETRAEAEEARKNNEESKCKFEKYRVEMESQHHANLLAQHKAMDKKHQQEIQTLRRESHIKYKSLCERTNNALNDSETRLSHSRQALADEKSKYEDVSTQLQASQDNAMAGYQLGVATPTRFQSGGFPTPSPSPQSWPTSSLFGLGAQNSSSMPTPSPSPPQNPQSGFNSTGGQGNHFGHSAQSQGQPDCAVKDYDDEMEDAEPETMNPTQTLSPVNVTMLPQSANDSIVNPGGLTFGTGAFGKFAALQTFAPAPVSGAGQTVPPTLVFSSGINGIMSRHTMTEFQVLQFKQAEKTGDFNEIPKGKLLSSPAGDVHYYVVARSGSKPFLVQASSTRNGISNCSGMPVVLQPESAQEHMGGPEEKKYLGRLAMSQLPEMQVSVSQSCVTNIHVQTIKERLLGSKFAKLQECSEKIAYEGGWKATAAALKGNLAFRRAGECFGRGAAIEPGTIGFYPPRFTKRDIQDWATGASPIKPTMFK